MTLCQPLGSSVLALYVQPSVIQRQQNMAILDVNDSSCMLKGVVASAIFSQIWLNSTIILFVCDTIVSVFVTDISVRQFLLLPNDHCSFLDLSVVLYLCYRHVIFVYQD